MAATKGSETRAWANEHDVKPGITIEVDGGFTCISKGERRKVLSSDGSGKLEALYFECTCTRHFLIGQLRDDGSLLGVFLAD